MGVYYPQFYNGGHEKSERLSHFFKITGCEDADLELESISLSCLFYSKIKSFSKLLLKLFNYSRVISHVDIS